jgi:DNA-binding Lrp family transcriptional regulator
MSHFPTLFSLPSTSPDGVLMNGNKKPNNVHMRGAFHKFYLLKPKHTAKLKDVADSIMNLKDVQELYLTEGDYGFMLKTRFSDNKKPDEVERYLMKNVDPKFGAMVSYYRLKKVAERNSKTNEVMK